MFWSSDSKPRHGNVLKLLVGMPMGAGNTVWVLWSMPPTSKEVQSSEFYRDFSIEFSIEFYRIGYGALTANTDMEMTSNIFCRRS